MFVQCWLSCPSCSCPVISVLSWLSFHGFPVLVVLSQLSCIFYFLTVLLHLSWHSYPATVVLSQLSSPAACPSYPVPVASLSTLVPPVFLSPLSSHAAMFWLCPGWLFGLTCSSWYVSAVLSRLSCPGCPVLALQPQLSRTGCAVPAVVSLLSYSGHPLHSVLSRLTWSGWPFWPTCPDWPVPIVLTKFPVSAVMSW